ncbi:MAG: hypothetical protein U0166_00540 [Acidobacteriota bacterium]
MTQMVKVNGDGEVAAASDSRIDAQTIFQLVTNGDCSRLTARQKLQYYRARCEIAGLDPRTTPFEFVRFQGKEILYAKKAATDQLNDKHGISHEILGEETVNGIRIARVRAKGKDGRFTDDVGAVAIEGLKGQDLANALMKTVTKAKRRATLSFCGMGIPDELELDTISGIQRVPLPAADGKPPASPTAAASAPAAPTAAKVEPTALDALASALEETEGEEGPA